MKIYRGRRNPPGGAGKFGDAVFEVYERLQPGEKSRYVDAVNGDKELVLFVGPLVHRVRHSPTGMNWGYGGSGPADLALSILWDHTGGPVAPAIYQKFKTLVANLDQENPWELAEDTVELYLQAMLRASNVTCARCADRGIVESDEKGVIARPCDACEKGKDTAREWREAFGDTEP